jgi:hypothetical protein
MLLCSQWVKKQRNSSGQNCEITAAEQLVSAALMWWRGLALGVIRGRHFSATQLIAICDFVKRKYDILFQKVPSNPSLPLPGRFAPETSFPCFRSQPAAEKAHP